MTDGCVHLLYNNSLKFHQLAAGQLLSVQPGSVRKRQAVHHIQNHTCRVTLLQPASWVVGFCQPSSLRPLGATYKHFVARIVYTVHRAGTTSMYMYLRKKEVDI